MFIESSNSTVTASLGGTRGMLVKMLGGRGGRLDWLAARGVCAGVLLEEIDGLGVAVFGDLKVFLVKLLLHGFAVAPGHDYVKHDGAGIGLEDKSPACVRHSCLAAKRRSEERGQEAKEKHARQDEVGSLKH